MTAQIICDNGRFWDAASFEFRAHLFLQDTAADVVELSIRRMGYIELKRRGASLIVTFNPALVGVRARAALYAEISKSVVADIAIVEIGNPGVTRLARTRKSAIELLRVMFADAQYFTQDRFRADCLKPSELGELKVVLDIWAEASVQSRASSIVNKMSRLGLNRVCVVERRTTECDFNLSSTSERVRSLTSLHLGDMPLSRFPDGLYAEWAATAYRATFEAGSPRIELLEADIVWPKAGRTRHKYRRVILPAQTDSGREALVVASASA